MDELIGAVILGVLLAAGALVVMAIGAWVRVGRLEQRVKALEARGLQAGPAVAAPPVVAATTPAATGTTPVVTATTPVAPTAGPASPPHEPASIAAEAAASPTIPAAPAAARVATSADWEQRIAGRWLNRLGLLAVAVGMAYFLKYAIDNDWIGPAGQVAIGVLIGAALVGCGPWFIKRGYTYFADGLAGLGAVILYLSAWAGTSYYQLFSPTVGFGFMVAITAGILAIALGQSSQRVAVLALLGGFMTPALVSTGRNAEIELFSYIALLNASLLPIAWLRRWRALELPAFALTVLYFAVWFDRFYEPPALAITSLFVIVFFAEFLALPILRARQSGPIAIEQTILAVVNPAVWLLVFRGMLWPDHRWALTAVTLALAAAYLVVARLAPASDSGRPTSTRLLFAGVALGLVTVAIPMRLDGASIAWAWAAEAAVLVWAGLRADIVHMRTLGLILLSLVSFGWLVDPGPAASFLLNSRFGTAAALVASAMVMLRSASAFAERVRAGERPWYVVIGVLANVVGIFALTLEVHTYFVANEPGFTWGTTRLAESLGISLLWAACATALTVIGVRTRRAALRWQGLALFGLVAVKVFFYDLADLRGLYRIASAVVLGVLLLAVSFLYQRRLTAGQAEDKTP